MTSLMPRGIKIYYVANARLPTEKAHGIQIAKMCEALIEAGADVEVVAPRRATDARSLKDFYGLRVDVPITRLPTLDWYGRGRIGYWISSFVFMFAYRTYLRPKRRERAILWAIDVDQFSFLFVPFLGIPYIAEIHDAKQWSLPFQALFRRAVAIVVINSAVRDALIRAFGISGDKITVQPNGIDLAMFAPDKDKAAARRALALPAEDRIALYAGKFYPWKGLETMIDAASLLAADARVYTVGGDAGELKKVTGRELPANLTAAGAREYREMPMWLAAADVLLLFGTKKNDYSYLHTSPMKLFEYMASGVPIVASATPANRAQVTEAEVFFYEPDNGESCAETVRYVLSHPDEALARAGRARESVAGFTWEKRARRILAAAGMQNFL